MPELGEWESFYLIVGGAAGALIGLQFVVITLYAESPPPRAAEAGAAFMTPTIIHFSTALLLSAIMSVPWHGMAPVAALWGLVGLAGVGYALLIARRMRGQTSYRPVLEDWLFHVLLPLAAYATLGVSALEAASRPHEALFGAGAAALALLFVGIHIAWDNVSYHVFVRRRSAGE